MYSISKSWRTYLLIMDLCIANFICCQLISLQFTLFYRDCFVAEFVVSESDRNVDISS